MRAQGRSTLKHSAPLRADVAALRRARSVSDRAGERLLFVLVVDPLLAKLDRLERQDEHEARQPDLRGFMAHM